MRLVTILISAAALLAACAGPGASTFVAPGTPRDQVIARAGPPARTYPLPGGGQRLQYTLQPFGHEAYNVDLDAAGNVVRTEQALTEAHFAAIQPGQWTRADVEREFGPPAMVDRVASWRGEVLTYRWRDLGRTDMFYWVYVDPQGRVGRAHAGMEFINGPADRN